LASVPARAQQNVVSEPVVPEKVGKELRALRIKGQPPVIDGRFDDEAWTLAPAIDDFVQNEPDNMAPPRDRTSVQIAYDDRTLYVAVRCYTQDPATVTTGLGRRDNLPPSDLIRMSFDPRHDHQTAYVFETNPSGMQSDYLFYDDTRQSPDYDAVWEVKTTITPEAWNAEYAIPFSQMRFTVPGGGAPVVWGFNLRRDIYKTGEYDRWVPTPRGAAGFVSRFGHVTFDDSFVPPRRFELQPVALLRGEDTATSSPQASAAGGLDMRIGLGTAATLSATINPDFAQVEQDPSVLNLSVFETFYPEKRPFFLEDSRLFVPNFPQMLLFHSRRIGRNPSRIALPDDDTEIERPDQTTIVGAAKLTGKVGSTAYGSIAALTAPEYATVDAPLAGSSSSLVGRTDRLVEPRTGYGVFRVLRDLKGGTSNVGGMATAVVRDGDANAFTGGVDHIFRWDQNRGSLAGVWAGSHAPVSGVQRDGFAGLANFNYDRKHFNVNAHYDRITRYFRNSDIGFLSSRINKTNVNYGVNLIQPDPRGIFRNQRLFAYGSESWNADNLFFEKRVGNGIDLTFRNFSGFYVEWSRDLDRLDDLDTRGGPPIVKPGQWGFYTGGRTDSRKTWQLFINANMQRDDEGGTSYNVNETLRMRPSTRLQAQINTSFQWGEDVAQWIKNEDVTGDGTDDNVYGRLRRNVVSITGRATYAFTRDMTLEAYLQPFVAVGDYTDVRRLARASSFDFESATLASDPDFNNKSLRANVVFRWEYVKGSALFVVWNRSTSDTQRPGRFTPFRDLGDAFGGPASDVVMVKLNYWLGL
jgi:hypothetical protein